MIGNAEQETARELLSERRKALRFPSGLRATCQGGGGKTGLQWPAVVRNLSMVGAGLVLSRPFSVGTQFSVWFHRGEEPLRVALMRVTHCRPEGDGHYHGCAFLPPLTEEAFEELNRGKPICSTQVRGIPCIVERISNGKVVTYSATTHVVGMADVPLVQVMGYSSENEALEGLERHLARLEAFKPQAKPGPAD